VQDKALELILPEVSTLKAEDGTVLKEPPAKPVENENDGELAKPDAPARKLLVRSRDAGKVIGRAGETIRSIMEKSGADIKVQRANEVKDPKKDEREVLVIGTDTQQKLALDMILQEVAWCRAEDGEMLKEPTEE
jgi:polyribonucleotide nucleotidyltransferase